MPDRVIDLDELSESFVRPVLVIGGKRHEGCIVSLVEAAPFVERLEKFASQELKPIEIADLGTDLTKVFGFDASVIEHVRGLPTRGIATVIAGFSVLLHGGLAPVEPGPSAPAEDSGPAPSS